MDAFIGEIRAFPYNYIPAGWLQCNGQLVSIQQQPALHALLGNKFGGVANQTFGVPNLTGLVVMGVGQGPGLTLRVNGTTYGTASVQLATANLPPHIHDLQIRNPTPATVGTTTQSTPTANSSWLTRPVNVTSPSAIVSPNAFTGGSAPNAMLHPSTIGATGGGTAHPNMQPYLPLVYCINFDGVFPDFN